MHRRPVVGGGYGPAPLLWLAQRQLVKWMRCAIIGGARTALDVLYARPLRGLFADAARGST
ncbi:MAG: hypothetical protein R2838_06220 [Caldilineaceae bacterium]